MRQLTRSWTALAALGAALLYGAVGAGAIGEVPLVGAIWIALAVAQAVFGLQSLRGGRLPSPAISLTLFLLPLLAWALFMMLAPVLGFGSENAHHGNPAGSVSTLNSSASASLQLAGASLLPLLPLLSASALSVGVAAQSAFALRRSAVVLQSPNAAAPTPVNSGRFVVGLVIGALAVSALVTPALAETDAGRLAVPHGEHSSEAPLSGAGSDE